MTTYEIIRAAAELIYFIVVSGGLLLYAVKTYNKSIEKKSDLVAQVYVDYKSRLERGISSYPAFLQIYNAGNAVAKDIYLETDIKELEDDYTVFNNNLGFIEPENSIYIPIGNLDLFLNGENTLYMFGREAVGLKNNGMKLWLKYDVGKIVNIDLNIEYFLTMPRTPLGRSSDESTNEKIEKHLSKIGTELGGIESGVKTISKKKFN